jgi:autotransporter-associated beta strand protein
LHFVSTVGGIAPTLTFSAATAASSTWIGGDGNWTDTANWADSTVAEGIDQVATLDGVTAVNITMDANRSVGALAFSGAAHTISGGNLALNVTSGSPTVSVETGRIATIGATLAGIDGLTKTGAGTLTIDTAQSYTGSTTVNEGGLTLTASGLIAAASNIQVNAATLAIGAVSGGRTMANNVVLNGGTVMVQISEENTGTGGTITFSGGNVIHSFTASGTLDLPVSVGSASELIVGGGGGGGDGFGTAGTANTGRGGRSRAAGGSGIAIVQYAYTAAGPGVLTLNGTVDLQSASTLDAAGVGGLLDVTGLISTSAGSGGPTIASSITSGGFVRFGSANTYLGDTTVNAGATLRMNTTNALPSGSAKGNLSLSGTLDLNAQV